MSCQCQSEFVNVARIAKLFRSPRKRKTVRRQSVMAITREMTSGRGMSLDVDGRQAQKGKTETCFKLT